MNILLQTKELIDLNRLPTHLSLKCLTGQLWVTCQGDRRDYLLQPGMEYRSLKQGKVVVWALTEASLCVFNSATQKHEAPVGMLLQA